MAEELHHSDGGMRHPTVRYERTDASFAWVFGVIVAAAVFGLLIHVIIWGFFREERAALAQKRQSKSPLAPTPSTALPPEPRLEQLDRLRGIDAPNVYVREAVRDDRLSHYGQTGEKGYVHVPIDLAIQILSNEKTLPVRKEKEAGTPHDNGLVDGGAPNSGRLFNTRRPR
jgi:hypothetical protein